MKLLVISLFLTYISLASHKTGVKANVTSVDQQEAFAILDLKCNVCHVNQNPRRVFTIGNMNASARKINRQVFVWKRMPKGNEIKLTEQEKQTLKKWINIQLNK